MGKLVRDKIPEIIKRSGRVPSVVTLDPQRYVCALRDKLLEEADELRSGRSPESVLGEAADVLEVVSALAGSCGISLDTILAAAQTKRAERGGFDMRLWLEGVESVLPQR